MPRQAPRIGSISVVARPNGHGKPESVARLAQLVAWRPTRHPPRRSARREPGHEPADDAREARPGLGAGGEHLLVGEWLAAVAGARVRRDRHPAHLEPAPE